MGPSVSLSGPTSLAHRCPHPPSLMGSGEQLAQVTKSVRGRI